MRNTAVILVVLFIHLSGYAQIKTKGFIEIGWMNDKLALNENTRITSIEHDNVGYSKIILDFRLKNIHVEQELFNIFSYPNTGITFRPLDIKYRTRIYYKIKNIELGVEHMCMHPVVSQHNILEQVTRRRSHDKIFIKYSFGTN